MNAHDFAKVGLRLLAVFVALHGLVMAPLSYDTATPWSFEFALLNAAVVAWPLVLALGLWLAAYPLARHMVGSTATAGADSPLNLEQVQVVAISIAGFLFVFYTVPSLVGQVVYLYKGSGMVSGLGVDRRVFDTRLLIGIIALSVKLLLGMVLMTTPRFWVGLLRRLREVGLPREESSTKAGGDS